MPPLSRELRRRRTSGSSTPRDLLGEEADAPTPPRLPAGFVASERLGVGGFASVWRCRRALDGTMVAIKHFERGDSFSSKRGIQSADAEVRAAALLDERRARLGEISELETLGLSLVPRLLRRCSNKRHLLLVYELGGSPLGKLLFDLKGAFHDRARVYEIRRGPVLREMAAAGDQGLRAFRRLPVGS